MKKIAFILTLGMILTIFPNSIFAWGPDDSSSGSWGSWGGHPAMRDNYWNDGGTRINPHDFNPYRPYKEYEATPHNTTPDPIRKLHYDSCMAHCAKVPVSEGLNCMRSCGAMYGY